MLFRGYMAKHKRDVIHCWNCVSAVPTLASAMGKRGRSPGEGGWKFSRFQQQAFRTIRPTLILAPEGQIVRLLGNNDGFSIRVLKVVLTDEGVAAIFKSSVTLLTALLQLAYASLRDVIQENTLDGTWRPEGLRVLRRPTRRHF